MQAARAAVHGNALEFANVAFAGDRDGLGIKLQVVGDKQIQVAIAVEIHERAAGSPSIAGMHQACLTGYVRESAVAIVAVQDVLGPSGDEDILKPIVVVVTYGYATEPARTGEPGFRGDVREGAVAIVLIQAIRGAFRNAFPAAAGEYQYVEPAIVVVIEKGGAAADGLQNVGIRIYPPV